MSRLTYNGPKHYQCATLTNISSRPIGFRKLSHPEQWNKICARRKADKIINGINLTAVSYTHLDVYKRQDEYDKRRFCQDNVLTNFNVVVITLYIKLQPCDVIHKLNRAQLNRAQCLCYVSGKLFQVMWHIAVPLLWRGSKDRSQIKWHFD